MFLGAPTDLTVGEPRPRHGSAGSVQVMIADAEPVRSAVQRPVGFVIAHARRQPRDVLVRNVGRIAHDEIAPLALGHRSYKKPGAFRLPLQMAERSRRCIFLAVYCFRLFHRLWLSLFATEVPVVPIAPAAALSH